MGPPQGYCTFAGLTEKTNIVEYLRVYGLELMALVNEMSPFLLLGFLFAGLLKGLVPRKAIVRHMGKNDFRSVLNAALLGIPLPLCSCGVLPAGIGFFKSGASRSATSSFLISTPQTGVDSIFVTYGLMGLPLAIIRPVMALVSGIAGGMAETFSPGRGEKPVVDQEDASTYGGLRGMFHYGFVELLGEISRWLVIGLLLAALLAVLVPADFFIEHLGNEYLEMGLMLLVSVPLYICATGSVPIAAVLLLKGLSPGAALVLLMAGPASNFATMAVIGKVMGRRSLAIYLSSIIGGALLFGILVNEVLPREWIMGALPAGNMHELHHESSHWFKWLSSGIFVLLLIYASLFKIRDRKRRARDMEEKVNEATVASSRFVVEGMTCNNCRDSVESAVGRLPGVEAAVADPVKNILLVSGVQVNEQEIRSSVEDLGFNFKGRVFQL